MRFTRKKTNIKVNRIISAFAPCKSCEHINPIKSWYGKGVFFISLKKDKGTHNSQPLQLICLDRNWKTKKNQKTLDMSYEEKLRKTMCSGCCMYVAVPTETPHEYTENEQQNNFPASD